MNATEQRRENAASVLSIIRRNPEVPRPTISEISGLNITSVSRIVEYLENLELVSSRPLPLRTKKAVPHYSFRGDRYAAIGLDLGRTGIEGVCLDLNGDSLGGFLLDYQNDDLKHHARLIGESVAHIRKKCAENGVDVMGGAVGVPGPVDMGRRRTVGALHFHDWGDSDIGSVIETELDLPVSVERNVNLIAWAEYCQRSVPHSDSLVYVEMSEGVGAAVVYNAEIYRGSSNFHSMLGHLVVEPHGKQCDCGKRGCLELYASRSELMGEDPEPAGSRTTKVADYVARGIGSMIDLFGIEDVAIGGKTIADLPLMFDQIREAIPRYVYTPTIRDLSIRRSRHGNHSVATSAGLWLVDTVLKELPMQR